MQNASDGGAQKCADDRSARSMHWFRIGVAALVAGQAMVFSLTVNLSPPEGFAYLLIHSILVASALAVIFIAGLPLIRQAVVALFQGRIVVEQLFFSRHPGRFHRFAPVLIDRCGRRLL
ncbi:hypothetical protein QPK87_25530 [Kamptonema cortianum]|nr:hypothetical protein [Kamptonema cortianum]